MAKDEGKRSKRSARKKADASQPSGDGVPVTAVPNMEAEHIPAKRRGTKSDQSGEQDALDPVIHRPPVLPANPDQDMRAWMQPPLASPDFKVPSSDLTMTSEPPEVAVSDIRRLTIHIRQSILRDGPAVQIIIGDVLEELKANNANDPDTQQLVALVGDLSDEIKKLVVRLEKDPDDVTANAEIPDLLQKIIAIADALNSNPLLARASKLLIGTVLLAVAQFFDPVIDANLSAVILTGIAFPEEAGKIAKLFKNAAKLLGELGNLRKPRKPTDG